MPTHPAYAEPQSPPTTYAIAAVLDGEPGGWTKVILGAAARSVFLAPGLAVSGLRGRQLALSAVLGSISITTMLFPYYMLKRKRHGT